MSEQIISKTTFLEYLTCPKNVWLKLHKPETHGQFALSDFELQLAEQGNEVEAYARNLFPGGVMVTETGDEACNETTRFMASRIPAIFQATFLEDGFLAKNDVLAFDSARQCWDIYEVKGTNSLKEDRKERDHINDVAFQVSVLRRAKVSVGRSFVVHLNKEYARFGDLDFRALFTIEDVTEKVEAKIPEIEGLMDDAKRYLTQAAEPNGGCECNYESRNNHCTTFAYSHPKVPEYSIHDLSRIGNSKKKLLRLVNDEIYSFEDIPDDVELSDNQKNQIEAHRTGRPIIDKEGIATELASLKFPLYFFDYETYAPAIPMFDGYQAYDHIPFQFSLHILRGPDVELEQVEFLQMTCADSSEEVARLLEKHVEQSGTVIVWHAPFEKSVNKEIARRTPELRIIMERINTQIYDLKEVFAKQYYVHPDFRGRVSIKKVLPAIVPELKYTDLEVQEGTQAMGAWWEMVASGTEPERKEELATALKRYCGMDTYAMYAIWQHLRAVISESK
jgi:hypothetical protein